MLVVKVGGSEGVDLDAVADDVAEIVREGERFVLVHGGSHETNLLAERLGRPSRFVTSPSGYTSRVTDRDTLEIFEMVCCGKINTGIVESLQKRGVQAVGLSGVDGRIWEGKRKDAIRIVEAGRVRVLRGDYTGVVERVNVALLRSLLDAGYTPVLGPPAISYDGDAINVDADRASAATAAALGARTLAILSNVPGLLRDPADETSLVAHVPGHGLDGAMDLARGRMRMKLLGAREALGGGVRRVVLGDARGSRPVHRALAGVGTVIGG
jgi:acetylglutamate/LysW-gamma-L-alpha-aminoadipate kinase